MRISSQSVSSYDKNLQQSDSQRETVENNKKSNNAVSKKKSTTVNKNNSSASNKSLRHNKVIDSLNKQIEKLMDYKKTVSDNAIKEKEDPKATRQKLEEIDKQIEDIRKQISDMQLEEQKKALGASDEDKKTKEKKNKENIGETENNQNNEVSNNDILSSNMNSLLAIKNKVQQNDNLFSIRKSIIAKSKVLNQEIAQDAGRLHPVDKSKLVSDLQNKLDKVNKKISEKIEEVNSDVISQGKKNVDKVHKSEDKSLKNSEIKDEENQLTNQAVQTLNTYNKNVESKDNKESKILNVKA